MGNISLILLTFLSGTFCTHMTERPRQARFRRARLSQVAYRAPGGGTPASRFECNDGMLLHDYRVATVAASGNVTTNADRRAYTVCAPAWKTRLASARGRHPAGLGRLHPGRVTVNSEPETARGSSNGAPYRDTILRLL